MCSSTGAEDVLASPYQLQEKVIEARQAVCLIQDELLLDGNPALNLAGFANTFMEPEIEPLMAANLVSNVTSFLDCVKVVAAKEHHSCRSLPCFK
jgi:glutamate/tyrosine decarboxylase-like PLP-dependent enzyme